MVFGKKGDLTSQQIVITVIAILGFAIVLSVFLVFTFTTESDEELCRLSVLSRATSPEAVQGYVPLKCVTKKLCLTDGTGKGECSAYFIGEESVVSRISKVPTDAARQVEETLANEMYTCWSMMGQGKLSLFSQGALSHFGLSGPTKTSCVICSRIGVEHNDAAGVWNVDANGNIIQGGVNINEYIATTQVPGSSLTYLQTFTDKQFRSFASAKVSTEELAKYQKGDGYTKVEFGSSVDDELAVVFVQIIPSDYTTILTRLAGAGAVGVGGAFAVGGVAAMKALVSGPGLVIIIPAVAGITALSMYNTYVGRASAAGFCGKMSSTLKSAENGCSSVMIVPYNVKTINELCGIIEGNP